MHAETINSATTSEIYDDEFLATICRKHYQVAERIHTFMAWQSQVLDAAASIGITDVDYHTLVERSRQILLFGPVYPGQIDGQRVYFVASLTDDDGYSVIPVERVATAVVAQNLSADPC